MPHSGVNISQRWNRKTSTGLCQTPHNKYPYRSSVITPWQIRKRTQWLLFLIPAAEWRCIPMMKPRVMALKQYPFSSSLINMSWKPWRPKPVHYNSVVLSMCACFWVMMALYGLDNSYHAAALEVLVLPSVGAGDSMVAAPVADFST